MILSSGSSPSCSVADCFGWSTRGAHFARTWDCGVRQADMQRRNRSPPERLYVSRPSRMTGFDGPAAIAVGEGPVNVAQGIELHHLVEGKPSPADGA